MYLTDFREQTLRDVITQIEPELFRKVTGLSVKDFDVLCDIGLFDPEKMNQGIFGFRRYENSSLNYTGIDRHEGEDIGGWDTVLRRDEYNALYANQQATLSLQSAVLASIEETPEERPAVHKVTVTKTTVKKPDIVTAKYGIAPPVAPNNNTVSAVPIKNPVSQIAVPEINVGDKVRQKNSAKARLNLRTRHRKSFEWYSPQARSCLYTPMRL